MIRRLAFGLLLCAGPASATETAQLAAACASCHGPAVGAPRIAGVDADAILSAMARYRGGERKSQIMHVISNALTPEETEAVARYLAAEQGNNQ